MFLQLIVVCMWKVMLAIGIRKNDLETITSPGNKRLGSLVDSDGNGDKQRVTEWGSTRTNTLW